MEPIVINVQVNFGMAKELAAVLTALVSDQKPAAPQIEAPAKPAAKPAAEKPQKPAKPVEAPAPEAPAPAPAPAAPAPSAQEFTEVDVRAAMDRARRRIEGEDYKENTTGEGYKTYHRALNTLFKKIATELGAPKPSALPDSESRHKFIAQCDALLVGSDGVLTMDLPNF